MRLIKLFTICTALITTVFTVAAAEPVKDTASVQKTAAVSNHTISMQILGLEYGYEQKLGGSFSMVFRAGLVPAGIYVLHDYFSSELTAAMKLGVNVEPRFYTNFDRRQRLGKSTYKNSADFVALKVQTALGNRFHHAHVRHQKGMGQELVRRVLRRSTHRMADRLVRGTVHPVQNRPRILTDKHDVRKDRTRREPCQSTITLAFNNLTLQKGALSGFQTSTGHLLHSSTD